MKIVVLGSGPAGLMAAQAAERAHRAHIEHLDITIVSLGVKSPLYGAQYLHGAIPEATPVDVEYVKYDLRGTPDDYREKVYGRQWNGTVSPEDLNEEHLAWDIRATYDFLWDKWSGDIKKVDVTPSYVQNLLATDKIDLIINSIPRPALCYGGHSFAAQEIWAAGDAPALGIKIPFHCPEATVVCNGEDNPSWYRMSRVFGHTTVEWPGELAMVPVSTASRVQKPLAHFCDCFNTKRLMHVGRYGEWSKGVLSHEAYHKTMKRIDQMIAERVGKQYAPE